MTSLIIEKLLAKAKRTDIPGFVPGDTIRVHVRIKEGDKERLQAFEGVVISRSRGPQASFTVRKMSFGQGVERIFPEFQSDRQSGIGAFLQSAPRQAVLSTRTARQSCSLEGCGPRARGSAGSEGLDLKQIPRVLLLAVVPNFGLGMTRFVE